MAKPPRPSPKSLPLPAQARQLSIAYEPIQLRGISPSEREKVLTHLARLLILAAGAETGESDDAER
jgi:hypothetical protein